MSPHQTVLNPRTRDALADLALACRIARRVIAREGRIADPAMRERLEDAAAHLNRLDLYPHPINISRVAVYHAPWFFTMRHNRGFIGVAMRNRLLFHQHPLTVPDHVLRHELCHIWQMQHRPLRMPMSFLNRKRGYWDNPYEVEARRAMDAS